MCLLRIDITHLIKMITRWSCFSKDQPYVKDFFVRCVALLSLQTNVKKFESLLLAMLIVAYSPKIDEINDTDHCFKSREKLLKCMKTDFNTWEPNNDDSKDDIFAKINDLNHDIDENYEEDNRRPIINFIENIEKKSQENITSKGVPNKYMCISFGKKLIALSKQFVLWTHIMPKLYRKNDHHETDEIERASSTRSEEYFKDVKNFILQKKTLRIDKVVVQHLRVLSGTVNLLAPNKHSILLNNDNSQERINDDKTDDNMSQDSIQFSDALPECQITESLNLKKNTIENSKYNQGESQNEIFSDNTKNIIESSINNTVSSLKVTKPVIDNFIVIDSCKEVTICNLTFNNSLINYIQSSKNDSPKKNVSDLLVTDTSPIAQVNKTKILINETEEELSSSILDDSSNYNNQSTRLKSRLDESTIVTNVLQDISSNNKNSYLNTVDEWKGLLNNKKQKTV